MKLQNNLHISLALFTILLKAAIAATCSSTLKASYPAPIVADGWDAQLIVQGLKAPRGVLFDSNGGLLVVDQGAGVVHLQFTDNGSACLTVSKTTYLINSTLVSDGLCNMFYKILIFSSAEPRHRPFERWQDSLRFLFRSRILMELRRDSYFS